MKLALISYEYPPDTGFGGIGTYAYQLAHMLQGRGHEVEVFAGGSSLKGSFVEEGISVHRIQEKQGEAFRQQVAKVFAERHQMVGFDLIEGAEHKADALYIRQQFPEVSLLVKLHTPTYLLGRLFMGKVSLPDKARFMLGGFIRGKLPQAYWKYDKSTDTEYLLTREADAILTPSLSLGDIVAQDWQINRERIHHLPNLFVPHLALLSLSPAVNQADLVRLTFIGKLEKRKGIVDLISAAKKLLAQYPELRLRLVGAHDHPSPRKSMLMGAYAAKELAAFSDRLELTGPVPNTSLPALLADSDICIFPSLWEASGYVCQEAMAAARAVIGSRAGGMAEMIEDKVNGLLIPPQSPEAIVEAMGYLVRHPDKRTAFGLKAREKVLATYNAEVIGRQTEEIYEQVIHQKQKKHA